MGIDGILKFDGTSKNDPSIAGVEGCIFLLKENTIMLYAGGFTPPNSNKITNFMANVGARLKEGEEIISPITSKIIRDQGLIRRKLLSFSAHVEHLGKQNLYQLEKEVYDNTNFKFSALEVSLSEIRKDLTQLKESIQVELNASIHVMHELAHLRSLEVSKDK
eukprot:Gb_00625 [translate_table: standard]